MHKLTNIDLLCPPCTKWVNGDALWIKCLEEGGICFVPFSSLIFFQIVIVLIQGFAACNKV